RCAVGTPLAQRPTSLVAAMRGRHCLGAVAALQPGQPVGLHRQLAHQLSVGNFVAGAVCRADGAAIAPLRLTDGPPAKPRDSPGGLLASGPVFGLYLLPTLLQPAEP